MKVVRAIVGMILAFAAIGLIVPRLQFAVAHPLWFSAVLAAALLIGFLCARRKGIKEGTWVGMAGVKAKYMWDHGSSDQRSLLLASIGVLDGAYRDGLLSMQWTELPALVQLSLAKPIEEIDKKLTTQ